MKKVIAIAIATALIAPGAFAAEDDLGMRYTSASEGFYASIRTEFTSGQTDSTKASIDDSGSRFGVQGSNDLGGGLEGFYRYEAATGGQNGANVTTRLNYVGFRGNFGEIRAGGVWDDTYNYVSSKSDMSPNDSGRFAWEFRVNNAFQYNTPDLNGFKAGVQVRLLNQTDGKDPAGPRYGAPTDRANLDGSEFTGNAAGTGYIGATPDENQIDVYSLSAKYSIAGFDVAGTYRRDVDGFGPGAVRTTSGDVAGAITTFNVADQDRWALGASYAQDNWYVGGYYAEEEQRKLWQSTNINTPTTLGKVGDKDLETLSLGGSVTVEKVIVFATWEQRSNNYNEPVADAVADVTTYDNSGANVGVIYNIGSQSRVWVEFVSADNDETANTDDDYINIGMRHNF